MDDDSGLMNECSAEIYIPMGPSKPNQVCSKDVQHYQWTYLSYNTTLEHEQVSAVLANIQLIVIGNHHLLYGKDALPL